MHESVLGGRSCARPAAIESPSYNVAVKLPALLIAACLLAQTPAPPRLTFDVVAIHPADPNATFGRIKPIPGKHGYTAENIPVRLMIALMYKIPSRQIEGGPSWLNTERFDVEARADAPHSIDDLHTMYQNLLIDRFGLRFHHEVREGNIYALTIDPSGLKLKPNASRTMTRFQLMAVRHIRPESAYR